jgi:anti-sigma B factor antagonist/stage II sporulation protein AA (anti-sigma F factor antagonist)
MDLRPKRFADTLVLSPAGRIDHATAEPFREAFLAALAGCAAGKDQVVLDLGGVEYIASAGLRGLMLGAKQVKAQGGTLVVAALQPVVREVFEISRFTLVFKTYPSVREALAAVSPGALAAFTDGRPA